MLSEYFAPAIDDASNCKIVTSGDLEIYLLHNMRKWKHNNAEYTDISQLAGLPRILQENCVETNRIDWL